MSQSSNHSTAPVTRGQCDTIDLIGKIAQINDHWQPRVVAEMNDYQFKVVKVEGEFEWHRHADTDEAFIVLDGELRIDFRAGPSGDGSIVLRAGQLGVVPKGVEHKPCANAEVKLLLIEPRGVVNTGDGAASERTVANDQWI
ncbi:MULTISPECIES: cupin domain-containing protein [unclassified Caballeronia]|jgi:mannose-6-phosphate isomerase-like protein (cupin superfamily)|uniref:cupin domain-containing protein n=1 Tax=unclassified Caballeronia TaxID=2646786 RepID=UPI0015889637|nr:MULTISPECIES: cupin domain-containing protein [Caballeronia]MCI1047566.1 cupin domain-containing protein [Caballeronia zhejiangensis]MDR5798342.1 cupin domain-containing protein [Caballeronia sp. LZ008]